MRIGLMLILLFATCSSDVARPQSSDLVGRWKLEITFENQTPRSMRFEAEDAGKGSLLLEGTRSNWDEPAKPSQAKWTMGPEKRVTISGSVEFPIGNVGREQGTLVFNGAFESEKIFTGTLTFFSPDQDPMDPKATPSKTGTFKATRVGAR